MHVPFTLTPVRVPHQLAGATIAPITKISLSLADRAIVSGLRIVKLARRRHRLHGPMPACRPGNKQLGRPQIGLLASQGMRRLYVTVAEGARVFAILD
jgi:hypothetical protein